MNKLLLYSLSLFFLSQGTKLTKNIKDNECFKIHDYDMHSVLHNLNHENIEKCAVSTTQKVESSMHKHDDEKKVASFWLRKLAVHALAQTAYALAAGVASLVYPPAAPIVYCSLQLTFAAPVEFASNLIAGRVGQP